MLRSVPRPALSLRASAPPARHGNTPSAIYLACLASLLIIGQLPDAAQAQGAAQQAHAESEKRDIRLAPGPLGTVLARYAAQSGVLLSFDSAQLDNLQSAGLQGSYTIREGFDHLLRGSGYVLERRPNGYALKKAANVVELDTVQVTALREEDLRDSPYRTAGSQAVLNREDIERSRGLSVGDIFRGIPGVLVGENRNSGGLDVNVRGMQGQGRVPVLIDGTRQETTVYRGYAGVASRSYVDPDLIGSVQIDKGPTMSAQGTGATGGLVSMRTINAEDIVPDGDSFGMRVRGSATGNNSGSAPDPGTYAGYFLEKNSYRSDCRISSYCSEDYTMPDSFAPDDGMDRPGTYRPKSFAGSIAIAKRLEHIDLVAAYAQRKQGNYYAGRHGPSPYIKQGEKQFAGWYWETPVSIEGVSRFRAGERIPNTQYESKSFLLKSNIYLNDASELDLSYLRYSSDFGEMMPSQIQGFGQARQWIPSQVKQDTYALRHRWQPQDNNWISLHTNLWHTDNRSDINTPEIYSVDIEKNTHREETYRRWGGDISNTMQFDVLGGIKLEYGVAGQQEKMNTDVAEGSYTGFYGGARSGKRWEASTFGNLAWTVLPSVTLNAGIRQTWFGSEDNNALPVAENNQYCNDADGDGECDAVFYKNRKSGSAPMFSLVWEPIDGLQFYGRYAEALRMPSLFETTSGWSVGPALDIDLKPEHTKNKEVGINYMRDGLLRSNDKLRLKFAYFRNHTKDYLTRTIPNMWEEGASYGFFRMRNIQGVRFEGLELSGSYDLGMIYTHFGATRYTRIEVCNVGSRVRDYCTNYGIAQSYISNMIPPNWHASVTLGTRLLDRRLDLGLRAIFMGERNQVPRYNAQVGFNAPVLWHSYRLFDLYANYKVTDQFSVDFTIDNLTDRFYLDALSLGIVPAPGRTARLGMTMTF